MFDKLNAREKLFVLGGGGFLVLAALVFAGRFLFQQRGHLTGGVQDARQQLARLYRIKEDLEKLPAPRNIPNVNALKASVSVRLEKNGLQNSDIRERVERVSKSEERLIVEISIKGAPLKSIIDFLYDVEVSHSVPMSVGKLQIRKPLPEREIYDVNISLAVSRPRTDN